MSSDASVAITFIRFTSPTTFGCVDDANSSARKSVKITPALTVELVHG